MTSQRLNRFFKKKHQHYSDMLYRGAQIDEPITDSQTGFIHHPNAFPLAYKRIWFADILDTQEEDDKSDIGLIFRSDKYFRPGITIELAIPLHTEIEKFRGKVVMVRTDVDDFEIGLWLNHRSDASRARIVEQICHIEAYLQEKKYREGPYSLNRDKAAAEWITKYASSVPSL